MQDRWRHRVRVGTWLFDSPPAHYERQHTPISPTTFSVNLDAGRTMFFARLTGRVRCDCSRLIPLLLVERRGPCLKMKLVNNCWTLSRRTAQKMWALCCHIGKLCCHPRRSSCKRWGGGAHTSMWSVCSFERPPQHVRLMPLGACSLETLSGESLGGDLVTAELYLQAKTVGQAQRCIVVLCCVFPWLSHAAGGTSERPETGSMCRRHR